jgi:DNA repair exonuclease SbcCD nuclease subunit
MSLIGRSFLHASDLHLGSPLGALVDCEKLATEDLENLVKEMWQAFDNLIDIAIERQVLFVVLAGDVYDNLQAQEGLQARFRDGLQRLGASNINVYMIHGNHDPLRDKKINRRPLPDNVHVFQTDKPHEFIAAESEQGKVFVSGISFASAVVTENLASLFNDLPSEHARWRVGVLHTSMAGSSEHSPYAPCSVEDLRRAPVGYWALGHIHLRSDTNSLGIDRWWAYPGNLQGRNFKPSECHPKGVLLITLNENGFDKPEFVECDTIRFINLGIDVKSIDDLNGCYDLMREAVRLEAEKNIGHRMVVRIELFGRTSLSKELRMKCDSGELLRNFCEDYELELQETIVAGITSQVKPAIDLSHIRTGDSLLATTLRQLDGMSDEEVVSQAKEMVSSTASGRVSERADLIRQLVEKALVEAILENEER